MFCGEVFLTYCRFLTRYGTIVFYLKSNIYQKNFTLYSKVILTKDTFLSIFKQQDVITKICEIKSNIPQGSIRGSFLYFLYTVDLLADTNISITTFADNAAVLAIYKDISIAFKYLRSKII